MNCLLCSDNTIVSDSLIINECLDIILYQNSSEPNRVDKTDYLVKVGTLQGHLRQRSSITDLVIQIEYQRVPDFNYIYFPMLNRYYYVEDISSVNFNLWEISCRADVLMSYKAQIKKVKGLVLRNENEYNPFLKDDAYMTNTTTTTSIIEPTIDFKPLGLNNDTTIATITNNILLIVAGVERE